MSILREYLHITSDRKGLVKKNIMGHRKEGEVTLKQTSLTLTDN